MLVERNGWAVCSFAAALLLGVFNGPTRQLQAQEAVAHNAAEQKFINLPAAPTCAWGAVENGDPMHTASLILVKLTAGCSVPWHWHTPDEHVMMVSGIGQLQMQGAKPVALRAGGYALAPSKHVHQFHCAGPCVLFLSSDGAFDIHYVDPNGKELAPADALKPFKETPTPPAK